MNPQTLRIEGGLLSPDFLERIHEMPGQRPADFGLDANRPLVDEVSAIYADARVYWDAFQRRLAHAGGESVTTVTREQWVIPLLELLGYQLAFQRKAAEADGRLFPISHTAGSARQGRSWETGEREQPHPLPAPVSPLPSSPADAPPVHIVGADQDLGNRPPAGRGTMSPHALVQDYLNRTDHLWGIVTNGYTLRLLRDSTYFTRPACIEFDLRQLMQGEHLDEFILFYRLAHRTRLPRTMADAPQCLLEHYHQQAIEQGGRIRDGLRDAVEQAILTFANGFLRHPKNEPLRQAIRAGQLTARQFYQELLYLIYRLLFLMVAEERGLLVHRQNPTAGEFYRAYLGLSRLRALADEPLSAPERFDDLYLGLQTLFHIFHDETLSAQLALPPLNGQLFDPLRHIDTARLNNRDLLDAIRSLSWFTPAEERVRRRVNYAALDAEELGSVYEALLDLQPVFTNTAGQPAFAFAAGTERKSTGSFYTPPELVHELIQSALVPVIQERLAAVERDSETAQRLECAGLPALSPTPAAPESGSKLPQSKRAAPPVAPPESLRAAKERALLSLKICDPACGSGHFLLAAARHLGKELARIRSGQDEPAPDAVRAATRDVITHCLYGVDKNPLAVDLCKVALWIEGHAEGKPLTFLDHRIRCGDSLVGVLDLDALRQGIPDDAFDPVSGDDKATARSLKRRNREERAGQLGLLFDAPQPLHELAEAAQQLDQLPDDSPDLIRRKQQLYHAIRHSPLATRQLTAANLWTAAFFQPFGAQSKREQAPALQTLPRPPGASDNAQRLECAGLPALSSPITTETLRAALDTGHLPDARQAGWIQATAHQLRFFHWPLEFPEVFEQGGFDLILGNPPWEMLQLQEQEFFATRDPRIAELPGAKRKAAIEQLAKSNPALAAEFAAAKHLADAQNKFLRNSGRFRLTATGKLNTYALFAELARRLLAPHGRAGIIVPTGIATDDTCKTFFADLNQRRALGSLFDFENREALFPGVHRSYKFCLLTLRGQGDHRPEREQAPALQTLPRSADASDHAQRLECAGLPALSQPKAAASCRTPNATAPSSAPAEFAFFLIRAEQLRDVRRRFRLAPEDLALLNPNTRTCPVFRTRADADLTRAIYRRVPVLVNETTGQNPWGVSFRQGLFNMTSDSHLFHTAPGEGLLPLYEAKMVWQFDHRWATYEKGETRDCTEAEKQDPHFTVRPRYWVAEAEVLNRLAPPSAEDLESVRLGERERLERQRQRAPRWLLGFRRIARSTDERTMLASVFPRAGAGDVLPLCRGSYTAMQACCLLGNFNSLPFDYTARQKVGGTHMDFHYLKQIPALPPSAYSEADLAFIVPRVVELVYTAWDVQPFAADILAEIGPDTWNRWFPHNPLPSPLSPLPSTSEPPLPSPFRWDETRRAQLRAELDAYFARLYGLTRKQLRYILDPADLTPRELADILDPWEEVADPLDPAGYAARCKASDFPGETFRVLKEKELARFGEYRTRRLALEAWERVFTSP